MQSKLSPRHLKGLVLTAMVVCIFVTTKSFDLQLNSFSALEGASNLPKAKISHVFSPYTVNDEFLIVSNSWRYAAEKAARDRGIIVDLIGAVLPAEEAVVPAFARKVILDKSIPNYRAGASPLPTYGEIFTLLYEKTSSEYVMYTNADIAVVPDFYINLIDILEDASLILPETQMKLLNKSRDKMFSHCVDKNVLSSSQSEVATHLCALDALVYFENLGGRAPHNQQALLRFFKNPSTTVEQAMQGAYDTGKPDTRVYGNAVTITRRQLPKAVPSQVLPQIYPRGVNDIVNETRLIEIYDRQGVSHPGNDMFAMPRNAIPRLLRETPFIHLRPSGFLIGELLKLSPKTVFRRIMSARSNRLTYHVGMGTDEWPNRADLQSRAVLFEIAQYYTRLNLTTEVFWPPTWCSNGQNFRRIYTEGYCKNSPTYCRGWVRLACTFYFHRGSRDLFKLSSLCRNLAQSKLDEPICSFCNQITVRWGKVYKCSGRWAKECDSFPCHGENF